MFCHVANLLATLLSHYLYASLYGQHLRRDYATTSCTELEQCCDSPKINRSSLDRGLNHQLNEQKYTSVPSELLLALFL